MHRLIPNRLACVWKMIRPVISAHCHLVSRGLFGKKLKLFIFTKRLLPLVSGTRSRLSGVLGNQEMICVRERITGNHLSFLVRV